MLKFIRKIFEFLLLQPIYFYRAFLSPLKPSGTCRFTPTCSQYAIEAINKGSIYPTILNAANEVAVGLFLEGKIKFLDIEKIVKEALDNPIYEKFVNGDLTITKIMSVDELVRIQILTKYR